MGYKTPLVCKEVYLPIDYLFIDDLAGENFKTFANAYKERFGIDLHDLFYLSYVSEEYRIIIKSPAKIYSVSVSEDNYPSVFNVVKEGIIKKADEKEANEVLLIIGVMVGADAGYGFQLQLPATTLSPDMTIDDLIVNPYVI